MNTRLTGLALIAACGLNPASEPQAPTTTPEGLTSLCGSPGHGKPLSPIRLTAEHVSVGHSRDRSRATWRGSFDGRVLTVFAPYGGCVRGNCKHAEVSLILTTDEVAALTAQLNQLGLWTSLTEADETRYGSPSHETTATIELVDNGRTAKTVIQYGSGYLGKEPKRIQGGSLEARTRARDVLGLLRELQRTTHRCFPDFGPP